MKKLVLLGFLAPLFVFAQEKSFTIKGSIGQLNAPAKVYLDYTDNGISHEDSAAVVHGQFELKGKLSGIATARMALDHDGSGKQKAIYTGDVSYLYFGPESFTMQSKDSLANAKVMGSQVYQEHLAYLEATGGSIMSLTKAVNAEFKNATVAQQQDSLFFKTVDQKFRKKLADRTEKQFAFSKANPKSYFGLVAISEAAGVKVDVPRVRPLFLALDAPLKTTDMGRELGQRIEANSSIAIGKQAPNFSQQDVTGKAVSLESLKGKVVLIEFWASWCGPCRAENPNLVKEYNLYKNKGLEVLAVSLDSERPNWLKAIQDDGMPWIHVSDLKGWNNEVGRAYGIRAVPANFLVDQSGKILATNLRGDGLRDKLAEVFVQ